MRDRVRLRERLPDEGEARRQPDSVAQRDPLEIGERLAGRDRLQRAPVVPRQLTAELMQEARLVGVEGRQREREQQRRGVLRAVCVRSRAGARRASSASRRRAGRAVRSRAARIPSARSASWIWAIDFREQVGTRREQLAELQVGGAELLERAAELDRALAQDAQEPPAARGARNLERAPRALESGHSYVFSSRAPVRN